MKQFMALFFGGYPLDEQEEQIWMRKWEEYIDELKDKGVILLYGPFALFYSHIGLQGTRVSDMVIESDDPSSFIIVQAESKDDAIALFKNAPNLKLHGEVVVFQINQFVPPEQYKNFDADALYLSDKNDSASQDSISEDDDF